MRWSVQVPGCDLRPRFGWRVMGDGWSEKKAGWGVEIPECLRKGELGARERRETEMARIFLPKGSGAWIVRDWPLCGTTIGWSTARRNRLCEDAQIFLALQLLPLCLYALWGSGQRIHLMLRAEVSARREGAGGAGPLSAAPLPLPICPDVAQRPVRINGRPLRLYRIAQTKGTTIRFRSAGGLSRSTTCSRRTCSVPSLSRLLSLRSRRV